MHIDEILRKIKYHREYKIQGSKAIIIKDASNIFWVGVKGETMRSLNNFTPETKKYIVENIVF